MDTNYNNMTQILYEYILWQTIYDGWKCLDFNLHILDCKIPLNKLKKKLDFNLIYIRGLKWSLTATN